MIYGLLLKNKIKFNMKKIFYLIVFNFVIISNLFSQNIPQALNWQGIIRGNSGNPLENTSIGLQFSIHQGGPSGIIVYSETHALITTENGLVSLVIGTGATSDNFSLIDWGLGDYFLEIAIDINGGNAYASLGTSQLLSVPFALLTDKSKKASSLIDFDEDTFISFREAVQDTIKISIDNNESILFTDKRIETDPLNNNVLIGKATGKSLTTGGYNIFIGSLTGYNFTTGFSNIGIGEETLMGGSNNASYSNIALGSSSFRDIQGNSNVGVGNATGNYIKNGNENVFLGNSAGRGVGINTVNNNVIVGAFAGQNNEGSGNVFLGYKAGFYNGIFSSNKLYIENSNSTDPLIYGEFDNDLLRVNGNLEVKDSLSIKGIYGFPNNAGLINQVLTFDGSGITSWKDVPSSADNLGNHTATENIKLNGKYLSNDGDNEGIFINTDGEVGIGTNNPKAALNLSLNKGLALGGNSSISSTHGQNTTIQIATDIDYGGTLDNHTGYMMYSTATSWANTALHFTRGTSWETYSSTPTLSLYGENVGIGNNNPTRTLEVEANRYGFENFVASINNSRSDTSAGRADVLLIKGAGNIYYPANQSSFIQFESNRGDYCGRIKRTGTSSLSLITSSDKRLKENLRPTKFGLNNLLNIKVYDYNFIADGVANPKTGFMAQELYEVYPEAVNVGGDNVQKNPWGVDYSLLTPILVQSVQDQQKIIEDLKKEISSLKEENTQIQLLMNSMLNKIDTIENKLKNN